MGNELDENNGGTPPLEATPPAPDGVLYDATKHMPLSVVNDRLQRARNAERAQLLAELGAVSVDDVATKLRTLEADKATLEAERLRLQGERDAIVAQNAEKERRVAIDALLAKAGVVDVNKAYAVATVDGVDLLSAVGTDGVVNEETLKTLLTKLRTTSPFIFTAPAPIGTGSTRQGTPPNHVLPETAFDKQIKQKYGKL